jgi:glycerate kinase
MVAAGYRRVTHTVRGPTGEPVDAAFAVLGPRVVVEMAEASGLHRLPGGVFAPLTATTHGTGELIRAALDAGAREIVLGVGGSATTDGGAGMLQALGARLASVSGQPVEAGGAALRGLNWVDLTGLDPRLDGVEVILASDVDNPLLGPNGAASVYGPQKGANPDDVAILEAGLAQWRECLVRATGIDLAAAPGADAAGGIGFAALTVLNATRRPGIDMVLDAIDIDRILTGADLVVVGEGRLDAQSLCGKAPIGIASRARARGIPVVAVAGQVDLDEGQRRSAGIEAAYALADLAPDIRSAIRDARDLLRRTGALVAARHVAPAA